MRNLFPILSALIFAAPAIAGDYIICLKETPRWHPGIGNSVTANGAGPGLAVDLKNKKVSWVATGSWVTVEGEKSSNGVKITKVSGRNPFSEKILSIKDDVRIYNMTPVKYGINYTIEIADSMGGTADLALYMMGPDLNTMKDGSGTWKNPALTSKEEFQFCTDQVK